MRCLKEERARAPSIHTPLAFPVPTRCLCRLSVSPSGKLRWPRAASRRLFVVHVTTKKQKVPSSSSSSSSSSSASVRTGYYQTHTESNVKIAEPRRLDDAFFVVEDRKTTTLFI